MIPAIRPAHDRVLIKLDPEKQGLIHVDRDPGKGIRTGVVVKIGWGAHTVKGVLIPITLEVGQRVSFGAGDIIWIEESLPECKGYVMIREGAAGWVVE